LVNRSRSRAVKRVREEKKKCGGKACPVPAPKSGDYSNVGIKKKKKKKRK